jgi:hypothetical protein
MTRAVSLSAVMSRVDQILALQQQVGGAGMLAPGAAAAGSGVMTSTALGATNASFASTLAQAQGTTATAATSGLPSDVVVPSASWNPQGKPVASWIVPVLDWASQHGWTGSVTSGYRSYSEQASLNAQGVYSAPAGKSNHESSTYPGGAVDVTDPAQLIQVLKGYTGPQTLVGGVLGSVDPEHFSATGH